MSPRRGAEGGRAGKPGSHRKGPSAGSGGKNRRALRGKGPTPPAEERKGHPAQRRARAAAKQPSSRRAPREAKGAGDAPEVVAGRNAVLEALASGVPATALYVATGLAADQRVRSALAQARARDIPILEGGRAELDRLTGGALHQGLALQVPAYDYAHPADLLARAAGTGQPALVVALDGVTDPRNLGAIVRSAAAFGAHGVVVPVRRSAGMTAGAWKASAGAAARLPVARATNLVRTLKEYAGAGCLVVGLAADGGLELDALEAATGPIVLVVGSEGRGLSRLVAETCDTTVAIPMAAGTESLNAGVAAGIVLHEVARRRG